MIADSIRLCSLKSYEDNYATVVLLQGHGSEEERTIPEVITSRMNSGSQGLPDVGSEVLVAFDNLGDAYLLWAIGTENQPLPDPGVPEHIICDNGAIKAELTKMGGFKVENSSNEIVGLLFDLVTELALTTVATSGGPTTPVNNAAKIATYAVKLATFKV
jgi:hypothetical protein